MKSTLRSLGILLAMSCLTVSGFAQEAAQAGTLRLHAMYGQSNMAFPLKGVSNRDTEPKP